jgi:hypothetical protein
MRDDFPIVITLTLLFIAVVTIYWSHLANARDYCPIPDPMPFSRGTGPCPRVPTISLPLCPSPVPGQGIKALVDSNIVYITDSTGRILTW